MRRISGVWDAIGRIAARPPVGVGLGTELLSAGKHTADVCIVTNCAFPGGNASTTATELLAFQAAGLKVLIIHCPVKRSPWKRQWLADRFLPHQRRIVPAHLVEDIRCDVLIARGPRMVMTDAFRRLTSRIRTDRALFIVNNSAWSENGKPVFDWRALHRRVFELGLPRSEIYPISPIIRAESERELSGSGVPDQLATHDWPPAFDLDQFVFAPRARLTPPIVIGRHARDHAGKWLESPEELRAAYPERMDIAVRIMGGAATAMERLGGLPPNWTVLPFGASGVERYLADLDVFVYFPDRARDEAFGRTVIEAVLSGLPVILPPAFEPTFGDLAFYCEPHEVAVLVDRLGADDDGRLHYLDETRREAAARYGTRSLLKRLNELDHAAGSRPTIDEPARRFRRQVMAGR